MFVRASPRPVRTRSFASRGEFCARQLAFDRLKVARLAEWAGGSLPHLSRAHRRRRVGGRQRDGPHRPHALPLRRNSSLFRLSRRGERDYLRPAGRQAVRAGALFRVPALLSARVCQPERGRAEALDAARDQVRQRLGGNARTASPVLSRELGFGRTK
jgi:hypothetical protein